jgi:hypothetical protein
MDRMILESYPSRALTAKAAIIIPSSTRKG